MTTLTTLMVPAVICRQTRSGTRLCKLEVMSQTGRARSPVDTEDNGGGEVGCLVIGSWPTDGAIVV